MTQQNNFEKKVTHLSAHQRALLERLRKGDTRERAERVHIPPRNQTSTALVSFNQQRMWFDYLLDPTSSRYHLLLAMRLTGKLSVYALETAIWKVIIRHEILRTAIELHDEVLQQIIHPFPTRSKLPFRIVDLTSLSQQQCATIKTCMQQEAVKPFDLARYPLFRITLLRVGLEEHILQVTMHHSIADEQALNIFMQDISLLYTACIENQSSPLPSLPIQYADYAIWQRKQAQDQQLEQERAYWNHQLQDSTTFLNLPIDYPRPVLQTFQGAMYSIQLDSEVINRLKLLGQQENATLFMTLLSAFFILLYRYSSQEDILLGTPITNRTHQEIEGLMGYFLNTLIIRAHLSASLSFRAFLAQVRETALAAYSHQDIPFEQIVEALHPQRNTSYHPLFQVLFALQNTDKSTLYLQNLHVERLDIDLTEALFDISLNIQERDNQFFAVFTFNTALFSRETVNRMGRCFQVLLKSIVSHSDESLAQLRMLPMDEERKMVEEWNATIADYPRSQTIFTLFQKQVEQMADAVVIIYDDTCITYKHLCWRVHILATCLYRQGVRSNSLVGICLIHSLDQVVTVLAILEAGGCCVPLSHSYPQERLSLLISNIKPEILVIQHSLKSFFEAFQIRTFVFGQEQELSTLSELPKSFPIAQPEDLCYVIHTSGSTGVPKSITMPHKALSNLIYWQRTISPLSPKKKTLQFASFIFDVFFQELFTTLTEGGTLILLHEETKRDPNQILSYVEERQIERMLLPFVALQQIAEVAQSSKHQLSSLCEIMVAGEQLYITPEIASLMKSLPNSILYNHYGPSETHVVSSHTLTGDPLTWMSRAPIGVLIFNTQLYLLDNNMYPVPIGIPGELYIGGESVCYGYIHKTDLTAERFLPDPFSALPGARLYKTGDLCRYLADGTIEYLDRLDQQVKLHGFRIELGEIEAVLNRHLQVSQAVVVIRESVQLGKHLVAYVISRQEEQQIGLQPLRQQVLQKYASTKLPDYMGLCCKK